MQKDCLSTSHLITWRVKKVIAEDLSLLKFVIFSALSMTIFFSHCECMMKNTDSECSLVSLPWFVLRRQWFYPPLQELRGAQSEICCVRGVCSLADDTTSRDKGSFSWASWTTVWKDEQETIQAKWVNDGSWENSLGCRKNTRQGLELYTNKTKITITE